MDYKDVLKRIFDLAKVAEGPFASLSGYDGTGGGVGKALAKSEKAVDETMGEINAMGRSSKAKPAAKAKLKSTRKSGLFFYPSNKKPTPLQKASKAVNPDTYRNK